MIVVVQEQLSDFSLKLIFIWLAMLSLSGSPAIARIRYKTTANHSCPQSDQLGSSEKCCKKRVGFWKQHPNLGRGSFLDVHSCKWPNVIYRFVLYDAWNKQKCCLKCMLDRVKGRGSVVPGLYKRRERRYVVAACPYCKYPTNSLAY